MRVLKFNELNKTFVHITDEMYSKIASEIEKDSSDEEECSGEIFVDLNDEFNISIDYKVSRDYEEVLGGSDEYGNYEKLSELTDVYLSIEDAGIYNTEEGVEYPSDFDSTILEDIFEKEYGA